MDETHPTTESITMNTKFLLGACGLLLVAGVASALTSSQERQPAPSSAGERHGRAHGDGHGRHGRVHGLRHRMRGGRDVARKLDISEAQRDLARQASRELAPLAEELRPQARAIVERARELRRKGDREGAKALLRDELRPLLERAKPQAERAVDPLLRSLTPEQRAKLEAAAQRRGKQFDEQRFAQRLGLALSSRRAQRRLGQSR